MSYEDATKAVGKSFADLFERGRRKVATNQTPRCSMTGPRHTKHFYHLLIHYRLPKIEQRSWQHRCTRSEIWWVYAEDDRFATEVDEEEGSITSAGSYDIRPFKNYIDQEGTALADGSHQ